MCGQLFSTLLVVLPRVPGHIRVRLAMLWAVTRGRPLTAEEEERLFEHLQLSHTVRAWACVCGAVSVKLGAHLTVCVRGGCVRLVCRF